jgi:hypothetical protein
VSSKCFQLYYKCSDRLLAIALLPCSFHMFSPLTVTFPKLSVILRPLYAQDTLMLNLLAKVIDVDYIMLILVCYGVMVETVRRIAHLVHCLAMGWTTGRSRFDPRRGGRIFPLAFVSRPALEPTQHPVQWVPGVLSPGLKLSRSVTLTTDPHLLPRPRISSSYTSFPTSAFMACCETAPALMVETLCGLFNDAFCSSDDKTSNHMAITI